VALFIARPSVPRQERRILREAAMSVQGYGAARGAGAVAGGVMLNRRRKKTDLSIGFF